MITDPVFYLVAIPALLITGASKGGLGGGLGILAVPLIALTVSTNQTTGILLPVLCLMDTLGFWIYRKSWDFKNLRMLVPSAFIGMAAGTLGFHYFNEQAIRLAIGAIAVTFALHHWIGPGGARVPHQPGNPRGILWGAISGFTSFVAHAGTPPLQVYLLPQQMDQARYVGTAVAYFAVINYVKLVPYWWLGQLTPGNLATSLARSPLAPLGIALGVYLNRRLNPVVFYRVCYLLIFSSGAKLLLEGVGMRIF